MRILLVTFISDEIIIDLVDVEILVKRKLFELVQFLKIKYQNQFGRLIYLQDIEVMFLYFKNRDKKIHEFEIDCGDELVIL
jgi:hypothetical protein